MKGFSILHVDPDTLLLSYANQWSNLYCEIWKEPPWNEDFWKPWKVRRELHREIRYQHGEAFLALVWDPEYEDGKVVGFTHGYSVTCQEMRIIAGNGLMNKFFKNRERVYYVDELGVAKEYRGRRISLWLTRSLIHAARDHGLTCMLLRTDMQAMAARHLYQRLGFTELKVHDAQHPDRTYWSLEL